MKTILVPTDYSEAAQNAMHYAAELAKYENAKVILFHAYLPRVLLSSLTLVDGGFEEENLMILQKYKQEIKKKLGRIPKIELMTKVGTEVNEILKAIKDKKADMVVMGITGSGAIKDMLMGNTAISVMQNTEVPVMLIPPNVRFKIPEKIVVALENNVNVPESVSRKMKTFVRMFEPKLYLYNMIHWEEPVVYNDEQVEFHRNPMEDMKYELCLRSGDDLVEGINAFVAHRGIDMIMMMPRSHKHLSWIFHRSNTKKMAFHTHIPLLSMHE